MIVGHPDDLAAIAGHIADGSGFAAPAGKTAGADPGRGGADGYRRAAGNRSPPRSSMIHKRKEFEWSIAERYVGEMS